MIEDIALRDRLEIALHQFDEQEQEIYVTQVEDISEHRVTVGVPISYGELVELPMDRIYDVLFLTEKGLVHFEGKIVKYDSVSGFRNMTIELLSKGEKVQRRSAFRLACILPFNYYIYDEEDDKESLYSGIIKDISTGGFRFVSNQVIEVDRRIQCMLDFGSSVVNSDGTIIEQISFPKANYKYQYRVYFSDITRAEQEKIVQFIYEEQRRSLTEN